MDRLRSAKRKEAQILPNESPNMQSLGKFAAEARVGQLGAGSHLSPGAARFTVHLPAFVESLKENSEQSPSEALREWRTCIPGTYTPAAAANFAETGFNLELAAVSSNFLPHCPRIRARPLYLIRFGAVAPHLPRLNPSPPIVAGRFHALNAIYWSRSPERP